MKNLKGSFILMLTAFIWGTAFVAQVSGADSVGTFEFNASRCFVASLFLGLVILFQDKVLKKKKNITQEAGIIKAGEGILQADADKMQADAKKAKTGANAHGWPVAGGILCGIALFFAMSFQQAGISAYPDNVAASGRAGFLTATYVVMVAVITQLKNRRFNGCVTISVIGTLAGMYLLCISDGISSIYHGDVLVLFCAVCFTMHILVIDRFSKEDSVKLSCIQFLVTGILSMLMCLFFEQPSISALMDVIWPMLYAGVMSSGVAYTLQMIGQKYAEPSVASIVMSLESVFAVLAGCVLLNEILSKRELLGCALVFLSVILAQLPQFKKKPDAS